MISMRWRQWLFVIVAMPLAGLLVGFLLVGQGVISFGAFASPGSEHTKAPESIPGFSPEEAQRLLDEEFPVYWVSPEFQELTAVRVMAQRMPPIPGIPNPPTNQVKLICDTCALPGDNAEKLPACEPPYQIAPLEILTEPYCSRRPDFIPDSLKEEVFTLRGAEAYWLAGASQLLLYSQEVSISITGKDRDLVLAVANQLRSLTPEMGTQSAGADLGPVTAACAPPPPEPLSPTEATS